MTKTDLELMISVGIIQQENVWSTYLNLFRLIAYSSTGHNCRHGDCWLGCQSSCYPFCAASPLILVDYTLQLHRNGQHLQLHNFIVIDNRQHLRLHRNRQ